MIPDLVDGALPPGVHEATRAEVFAVFGWTPHRRALLNGFSRGVVNLANAGCAAIWLDGSFVTSKERPDDFDACWDPTGVELGKVDPILFDMSPGRLSQKAKYGGEFFPNVVEFGSGRFFVEFFQFDRAGSPKGIVQIDVEEWK